MSTADEGTAVTQAGMLVAPHSMCWIRTLKASLEETWSIVSTLEGLQKWWIVPGCVEAFELKPGGAFRQHWTNTVESLQELRYIDFGEGESAYTGTGGMRFELWPLRSGATQFAFLDTWPPDARPDGGSPAESVQPGGPGTPWSGVAAGWHCMLDQLEAVLGSQADRSSYDELCAFYSDYLARLYGWHAIVQRR